MAKRKAPRNNDKNRERGKEQFDANKTAKENQGNDRAWYSGHSQLTQDVSSFIFSNALREGIPLSNPLTYTNTAGNVVEMAEGKKIYTPGICNIKIGPTVGPASRNTDAVNVAARKIYADIRRANSGSRNYDAPDIMLYLLAMDSAYSLWTHMCRAYSVLYTYNGMNRYYPDALLEEMGFDPHDLRQRAAEFRAVINELAVRLSAFAVPMNMSLYQVHMWYYSEIFLDRPDAAGKAQTYLFTPDWFYRYVETNAEEPGYLTPVYWQGEDKTLYTVDTVRDFANELLNPIFSSEDIGTMSGDILKAFGDAGIFKFMPIPIDASKLPTYDDDILVRINNLRVFPIDRDYTPSTTVNAITQDVTIGDGKLTQSLKVNTDFIDVPGRQTLFNVPNVHPSADDMMYWSRLTSVLDVDALENARYVTTGYGTEIVTDVIIRCMGDEPNVPKRISIPTMIFKDKLKDDNISLDDLVAISWASHFHQFPRIYFTRGWAYSALGNTISAGSLFTIGDIDNFAVLTSDELQNMHRIALLNEFGISITV